MGGCYGWLLWVVAMGGCYGWLLWVIARVGGAFDAPGYVALLFCGPDYVTPSLAVQPTWPQVRIHAPDCGARPRPAEHRRAARAVSRNGLVAPGVLGILGFGLKSTISGLFPSSMLRRTRHVIYPAAVWHIGC